MGGSGGASELTSSNPLTSGQLTGRTGRARKGLAGLAPTPGAAQARCGSHRLRESFALGILHPQNVCLRHTQCDRDALYKSSASRVSARRVYSFLWGARSSCLSERNPGSWPLSHGLVLRSRGERVHPMQGVPGPT